MSIVLIGFMGCGKSSFGKKLANILNFKFYDLDLIIQEKVQLSIEDIFSKHGENYFRKIEKKCLEDVVSEKKIVLATGGGTPCYFDNMSLINNMGVSIYLYMNSKAIFDRLINSKTKRPLIQRMNPEQLKIFINEKLSQREPYYNLSNIKLNAIGLTTDIAIKAIENFNSDNK